MLIAFAIVGQSRTPPGVEAPSVVGVFWHNLVFDFGQSFVMAPKVDAVSVVVRNFGSSLLVLGLSVFFAGVVTVLAVVLVRRGNGRAVRRLGYVGAVPAPVWAVLFIVSDTVPTSAAPSSGFVGSIAPGLALAIPLAGFGARVAGRTIEDGGSRSVALDSWLLVNWLIGGLVAVSVTVGRPGVGQYLLAGLQNGDLPVFAAAAGVLTIPVVLASILREYCWMEGIGGEPPGAFPMPSDRRAVLGLLALGVLAVSAFGAGLLGSPATGQRTLATAVPGALFHVTAAVLVAGVVAIVVGVPLGALSNRVGRAGGGVVLDAATNVPMFVLAILFVAGVGSGFSTIGGWGIGLVVGLVTAPLVGKRTTRTFEEGYGVPEAIPVGGTIAALGGAFAAFLVVDVAVLRFGLGELSWLLMQVGRGPVPVIAILLVTSLPPFAALLVSEGLRPSTD